MAVSAISYHFLEGSEAAIVIASCGATAVLIFAIPHGALSQPWPILGGHLISAFIGVTCAQWISSPILAGAITIGLSIAAMHYLRCMHPPGGATGLTAVIGGQQIQELGYYYIVTPVLFNIVVIMLAAFLINLPFHWRRYPACYGKPRVAPLQPNRVAIRREDLSYALEQQNRVMVVLEDDLLEIYRIAQQHAEDSQPKLTPIHSPFRFRRFRHPASKKNQQ